MHDLISTWEPEWLLVILLTEMISGLYSAWILTVEYRYDKEWNERRRERRKRKMQFEDLNVGESK